MDEIYRKKFDEIRNIVEYDLYNSLFVVWRDEDYKIDLDYAISAIHKLKDNADELKKILLLSGDTEHQDNKCN